MFLFIISISSNGRTSVSEAENENSTHSMEASVSAHGAMPSPAALFRAIALLGSGTGQCATQNLFFDCVVKRLKLRAATPGMQVRLLPQSPFAFVAQTEERRSEEPGVASSILAGGTSRCCGAQCPRPQPCADI